MTRKITKATLDELEKEMAPLTEQEQQARLGGAGYDEGDCFWRCIAYFQSGGEKDITAREAMLIAKLYYGDNFNPSEYTFTGSIADVKKCINDFFGSHNMHATGHILVYDPTPDDGDPVKRAVVVKEIRDGVVHYYDPQKREKGTLGWQDFQRMGAIFHRVK